MKKLLSLITIATLLVLGVSSSTNAAASDILTCNGSSEEYQEVFGYDRICKLDGIWYGVINIESRNVFNTSNQFGTIFTSNSYSYYLEFGFTRDTKQLNKIVINVKHDEYNKNWTGIGGKTAALDETREYIFDDSQVGLADAKNLEEAFGNGNITSSVSSEYDYVIDLDLFTTRNIDVSIDILEFYYVLTDEEVTAVNEDIQTQYDREVTYILADGSLNETESQSELDDLNVEYQEYVIEFDEEIQSLCLDNEMCHFDYEGTAISSMSFVDFKDIIRDLVLIAVVVGIAAFVAISFGVEGFKILLKIVWSFIETFGNIIFQIIFVPILNGLEWFLSVFFRGLGGRY